MSMMRKLFRPGKGQKVARYVTAFCNGTAVHRGDFVKWDVTAPTDQGASGVLEGKTLGANDFIFVAHEDTTATDRRAGLAAGLVVGTNVSNTDTVTAMTNDGVVIVQTWGVFDTNAQVDSGSTVAEDILTNGASTVAGEMVRAAAAVNFGTDYIEIVAIALTADANYTRGTGTVAGCTAFVRCDG